MYKLRQTYTAKKANAKFRGEKRSKFPLIALFIQFERTFHQSTDTSKFSAPLIERSKCDSPRIQIGKSQLDKHNLHLMGKMPPRFRHDHFLSI